MQAMTNRDGHAIVATQHSTQQQQQQQQQQHCQHVQKRVERHRASSERQQFMNIDNDNRTFIITHASELSYT